MENIVFTICRMNPPTKGHEKLVKAVLAVAKDRRCDHRVFLTRTQDKKNNPLDVSQKLEFAKQSFQGVNIVDTMNVFSACREMAAEGYIHGILVVGQDRENAFETALNKYINHPEPEKSIGLQSIELIVIPRSVHDYSATTARKWAIEGDFVKFKDMSPIQDLAVVQKMYNCVRQGMGVKNE